VVESEACGRFPQDLVDFAGRVATSMKGPASRPMLLAVNVPLTYPKISNASKASGISQGEPMDVARMVLDDLVATARAASGQFSRARRL
jgi:hypothetical protein